MVPFSCSGARADYDYELQFCQTLTAQCSGDEISHSADARVFRSEDALSILHLLNGTPYALSREQPDRTTIFLPESSLGKPWHPYFLPDLLHLERPLLRRNCFVLHAAYIVAGDDAILFTAPSGGGKSTQAGLWETGRGARIINGDKCAVGKQDGIWFAHGLPVSGSSPHCLNESHPIRAIVIPEKAPENRLYPLGLSGFSRVLSQTVINTWDAAFCGRVMELVAQTCQEIPVFLFRCTKTPDAADSLYHALFEKEK